MNSRHAEIVEIEADDTLEIVKLEETINAWLTNYIADLFSLPTDEVDTSMIFERYGMDSSSAVGLSGDLGDWLGYEIDPMIAYNFPSIDELAKGLATNPDVLIAARTKLGLAVQ